MTIAHRTTYQQEVLIPRQVTRAAFTFAIAAWLSAPGSANAGDAFLCYHGRPTPGGAPFQSTTIIVTDETETRPLEVRHGRRICAPADIGPTVADPDVHLRAYSVRRGDPAPPYDRFRSVVVANALGELTVDVAKRPRFLLVPSAIDPALMPPAPDPATHAVDHYRCHRARRSKGTPRFSGGQVTVTDTFSAAKVFDVKRPTTLCTPVDALGLPVENPAGSLLCYRARRSSGEPRHPRTDLQINNEIGPEALTTTTEAEICLPSRAVARCNEFLELCDRDYDAIAHPTTHNAMSNAEEGWLGPNQGFSISTQLDDGVRALMLDTWYFGGEVVLCHGGDIFDCDLTGMKPLVDGLGEIKDFLDRRPNEVVSIIFESYVSELDTQTAFLDSGLLPYVHVQGVSDPWPTLRDLIDADTRLIVFTDDSAAGLNWHHYVWDFAWETHFSFAAPGDFSCDRNRGSASNSLFILNHFLTNLIGSPALASLVNYDPLFIDRAMQCESESGRLPNFVTVDHYDIGDLFSVVDTLNGVVE